MQRWQVEEQAVVRFLYQLLQHATGKGRRCASVVHRMDLEKQKNHLNEDIWLDITEIFFKDNCISDFPLHD